MHSSPTQSIRVLCQDSDKNSEVNLQTKTCSAGCLISQNFYVFMHWLLRIHIILIRIPCAPDHNKVLDQHFKSLSKFLIYFIIIFSRFYTVDSWLNSYAEIIYPMRNKDDWVVSNDIK